MHALENIRIALGAGKTSAERLMQEALDRAGDDSGEGTRVFLTLNHQALDEARAADRSRAAGAMQSPWAGIPFSIKDLFDVAGEVTRAGSQILSRAPAASSTAPAIQRLFDAGLVSVGRTNMTEFAYSGVGLNPHYGTPMNPWDRATGRIPGGSSSGAAVSVTDGMAAVAIGTDTGGSCRIPAALTGITGWKPSAARIPRAGVYPLSGSLDSVGVLGPGVACCAVIDDLMAGGPGRVPEQPAVSDLNLAVLDHYVTEGLDHQVAAQYERSLVRLTDAGASLTRIRMPGIEQLPALNSTGGIAAAEAYAFHAEQLARMGDGYDPRVGSRIRAGAKVSASELADIRSARTRMMDEFASLAGAFDAVLAPTVPIVAPAISEFDDDADYIRLNLLLLRNPSLFNFLDGCAISLPVHEPDTAPVGLMLAAPGGRDTALIATALAVEAALAERRQYDG